MSKTKPNKTDKSEAYVINNIDMVSWFLGHIFLLTNGNNNS